jgi:acetyl esterase/lipase
MSPASHRSLAIAMSESMDNARVFSVDYRLAPEAPFPRGLRDAVEAYYYLIESGVPAANIIVSGDSAGGGLSMALLLYLRDHVHLPDHAMIGGAVLLSPWTDLTSSCGSWVSNKVSRHLDYNFLYEILIRSI